MDHFWDNIVRPKRWDVGGVRKPWSKFVDKTIFPCQFSCQFLLEGNFDEKMMMKRSFREGILSIYVAFFESAAPC